MRLDRTAVHPLKATDERRWRLSTPPTQRSHSSRSSQLSCSERKKIPLNRWKSTHSHAATHKHREEEPPDIPLALSGTPAATATKNSNTLIHSTRKTKTCWPSQTWTGPHTVQKQSSLSKSADKEQGQSEVEKLSHHWQPHQPLTVPLKLDCYERQATDPHQRHEPEQPDRT